MKMKIIAFCIVSTLCLLLVPLVPSVESTTVRKTNISLVFEQLKTIDQNALKEKLHNYDKDDLTIQTIIKLINALRTDLHIVLPGVVIMILLLLALAMQQISIGPFLLAIGAYLELFVIIIIEILHKLGIEIYYPYPPRP